MRTAFPELGVGTQSELLGTSGQEAGIDMVKLSNTFSLSDADPVSSSSQQLVKIKTIHNSKSIFLNRGAICFINQWQKKII